MSKGTGKYISAVLTGIVAVAAVLIGVVYFNFISRRIYEDSTGHLEEIYSQVDRYFGAFVERNWGLLDSCDDYFALAEDADSAAVADFIREKQAYWGFSEFYFLSDGTQTMTADGTEGTIDLGPARELMDQGAPVMAAQTLPGGREVTVFAASSRPGAYDGFDFDAIAVSYTNADLAASLNVDAFSGQSKCFVIHDDGNVLLSTQTGGNVFNNYLAYLRAASDLDEQALDRLQSGWQSGDAGLVQCRIGGVDHCILYQPVGFQDYTMLSVVPRSAVSAGFLSVQKATIIMLAVMFLLVGAIAVSVLVRHLNKRDRRNRMELQYRERMFDVLSSSVDDIFIMLDAADQDVDYISPNIERLLGIPAQQAQQDIRVMEKCAVDCNVVIPAAELAAIPQGGSRHWECEYMHQSTGERRWYRMTVYHMNIQDVEKYIVVLSDRTLEQQMNQKLQQALNAAQSANEAKSNFLSNMSHDIRTPMNAIVGFSVLLERSAEDPEKVREYTRKITASSNHLLSLINDVLDMSKIESGKTSLNVDPFSLPEMLEELSIILKPQAGARGQSFNVDVLGAPPEQIVGDKLRVKQILLNLLSNAVKYTPEGGRIDFAVSELSPPAPQYVKLRFEVRDNGIGMSPEFVKTVFEPFSREINSVTNKIQGTGLGMAITKNLVDLMGGIIRVDSRQGEGTTFTVELSFALPEQEDASAKDAPAAGGRPEEQRQSVMDGRLFLVAEDNELNAEILTELLSIEGARCDLATDGRQAVDMFQRSAPGHYDMILMDVQMPVMNGYEATRAIRAGTHPEAKTIPIVAMTANTFAEDVRDAMEAGMDGHLGKPIDMDAMRTLLGTLLARGGSGTETDGGGREHA